MVHKLIISIALLILSISVNAQGNFFFNQHGSDECEYGNLDNYNVYSLLNSLTFDNCPDYLNISSASEARSAIVNYRNASCVGYSAGGTAAALWTTTVDSYVLHAAPSGAICTLTSIEGYYVVSVGAAVIPDPATIIQITSGVITYSESY